MLEVSDQTVVRRYRRMRSGGLIRVIGLPQGRRVGLFESWLRVQCAPDAALVVAEALARRPDISWVKLGSGGTEIHCLTRRAPAPTATACCWTSSRAPAG
ncbi:hypothetical protein ACFSNO_29270 [Streptomyces cirratus]